MSVYVCACASWPDPKLTPYPQSSLSCTQQFLPPPCHPLGPWPVLGISGHSKRTRCLLVSGRQNWTEKLAALNGQVWVERRSPRLGSQEKKMGQPGVIRAASWKKSPTLEGHKFQTDPKGNAGRYGIPLVQTRSSLCHQLQALKGNQPL